MRGPPLRLLKQVIKAPSFNWFDTPGHRRAVRRIFGAPRMPPTPRRRFREVFAKIFRKRWREFFSKNRSRRRDQFGPKIVKIRAILAIFRPFEVLGCQKNRIFERPFTPRGWLRSASNFGKTRFRRSPTFHLSTSKKDFRRKFLPPPPCAPPLPTPPKIIDDRGFRLQRGGERKGRGIITPTHQTPRGRWIPFLDLSR